jgi:hypothetical protein
MLTTLQIYTFAWIFGFFTSMLVHYTICTYISVPVQSMVEVAVYPPQKGEETPSIIEGEDSSTKEPYVTTTTEKDVADLA